MVLETTRVCTSREQPQLGFRSAGVRPVELAFETDGSDQQQRSRTCDLVHERHEGPWLRLTGGELDLGARDGKRNLEGDPIAEGKIAGIGSRPPLEAVRYDGFHPRVGCCVRDDCFGPGGGGEKADATHSTAGEIGDGAAGVAVPLPAEGILVACTFAPAARVVQEYAVACLGQQAGVADGSLTVTAAAVDKHDRSAVARAHVPTGEANPVGRGEYNAFVPE